MTEDQLPHTYQPTQEPNHLPPPAGARWRWWAVVGLLFLLVITPGPARSPFSGLPLSAQGVALFILVTILAVFSAYFPARARIQTRWLVLLAVLVVIKSLLSLSPVTFGWRGSYMTMGGVTPAWRQARFQSDFLHTRDYRIDRRLDFNGPTWGLHFINDFVAVNELTELPRDEHRPLRVRWEGHTDVGAETTFKVAVSAAGTVALSIDGDTPTVMRDPEGQRFEAQLGPGAHIITIEYDKPGLLKPRLVVSAPAMTITASPASAAQLAQWTWRSRAAMALSGLALLVVALAFAQAYASVSRLVLTDLWLAPGRLAAIAFFAFYALNGVWTSIPERHTTVPLGAYDDWIMYEAQARHVVFNGWLMTDEQGAGKPYYHYPFYSYLLAGAHVTFGEDFATVQLFNYLCIGAIGLVIFFLLHRHLTHSALVVTLGVAGLFLWTHQIPFALTSSTDNLYILIVMVVIAVAVTALERRGSALMWLAGVLTALAAATRPSFLFFAPFFVLALAADADLGRFGGRARQIAAYCVGFGCGVAPFTIRNWIVAGKFVLIVSSFIMLPYFLYPLGEPVPAGFASDSLLKSLGDFVDVWKERPFRTAWVETQKVLFTLGFLDVGPLGAGALPRTLIIWPILFTAAWWFGRVPRALMRVLLVFAVSHVAAMVVGAPWTYGYKTILPFHLALIVGAAFLLPRWGTQWWRSRVEVPTRLAAAPRTISVVLPTYNEKDSIRGVIEDFFATGIVSEVLVINNNAVEGTSEQVAGTGAREIFEARQGYGAAIRRGLVEARGDLICVCEPDGTFLARDLIKLAAFADDFEVVYGSRTSQQFIWQGANMGAFLRWGNWAVAKYMEFLYNATSLTDVGCTMRLLRRDVAERLRDRFRIDGSQFGPEMMVLTLKEQCQVIQIPVNYLPRVGESAVTGDPAKAFWLGLQMIWLITRQRFEGSRERIVPERSREKPRALSETAP